MPRKTTPRLTDAVAEHLALRGTYCAVQTMVNERALLRKFTAEVGNPRVHDLTSSMVEHWFAGEATRMKASSYNKVRNRIQTLVSFLQRRGWLTEDVLGEVRPRKVQKVERRRLSTDQLRRLIECAANERDRALIAVSANTGLRAGDLRRLKVGDVDLDQGVLRVTIHKTSDCDEFPLTADLEAEVRVWLTRYAEQLVVDGLSLEPHHVLFPVMGWVGYRRRGPLPTRAIRRPHEHIQLALSRMGIKDLRGEGAHTIRRCIGRLVFEQAAAEGRDGALRVAAAVLQHKSVQTTEEYLGINGDRLKRDQLMRGRSILGPDTRLNVVPLRVAQSTDRGGSEIGPPVAQNL